MSWRSRFVSSPPGFVADATETDAAETGSTETGSTETGSTETGSTETGSTETGSNETSSTETSSTETDATETDATKPGSTETGSTAVGNGADRATGGRRPPADREAEFAEFVRGASTSLHRTAYLLTGSRESAQDAVQTALTRVYLVWDRHNQWDNPTAYARQVVVNVVLTGQRRKWTGELPQAEMSDRVFGATADRSTEVVERDALRRALDALPIRQRTAVVLRHYLDLSEAQTAAEMGTPVGTIKSLTARGLDALRGQLKEVAT